MNMGKAPKDLDLKSLRKDGGQYIKNLRLEAGLTQRELSDKIGMPYYTFISQIESGNAKLNPSFYEKAALAFGVEPKIFVKKMSFQYRNER